MNWFVPALLAVMIWAVSSHIDKYLLSKFFVRGQVGALLIFSAVVSLVIPVGILIFSPVAIFSLPWQNIFILLVGGALLALYLIPYYYALGERDTSLVSPMFQAVSVFSFILGFVFLREQITWLQTLAGFLVVGGAVFLSFDFGSRIIFQRKVFLLMLLSSFIYALSILLFKWAAVGEDFWVSIFWEALGASIFGFFLLLSPKYREQTGALFRESGRGFLPIMAFNELVNISAKILANFATLLAPIVLITLVGGTQPFFVFLYGVILTVLFPSIGQENITHKAIFQKVLAILVIFIGTAFLVN